MSTSAHLEEHTERLRARKKATVIYALLFLALLLLTSLGPTLLVALAGYRPDALMVFLWFFLSMPNVIQISTKTAEGRMLEQTLELIEVLQEIMAKDRGSD